MVAAGKLSGSASAVDEIVITLQRLPELEAMLAKTGGKIAKMVEYTSYPEAYQDLALGRTDFVINTVINLQALVDEKPNVFALGQAVSGPSFPLVAAAR